MSDGFYVAVKSIDDRLTVIDAESGTTLWRQEALQPALTLRGSGSPVIFSEGVFAGFSNGEAKAFSLKNGSLFWGARVAAPKGSNEIERMIDIKSSPLISGKTIFFVSFQGNIAALDLYSGRERWSKELSSYESMTEGYGSIYLTDESDYVVSLDQRIGASNWRQQDFEYRKLSAPSVYSSYVVVGDYEGYVHFLSQLDGSQVGRFRADSSAIKSKPLVDGELIFVLSADGELVALKEEVPD